MDVTGDKPGVIAPPPLIALAVVVLGLLLDWVLPAYVLYLLLSWADRIVIGGILMIGGMGLGLSAVGMFWAVGTNVEPWKPAIALARNGIFRWLRNPMYVGLLVLLGGLSILLASDWMLVLTIGAAFLLHYGVVLREERYLTSKFGADYEAYRAAVPRYGWPF